MFRMLLLIGLGYIGLQAIAWAFILLAIALSP
jgi:hypothetical protein